MLVAREIAIPLVARSLTASGLQSLSGTGTGRLRLRPPLARVAVRGRPAPPGARAGKIARAFPAARNRRRMPARLGSLTADAAREEAQARRTEAWRLSPSPLP